MKGHSVGIVKTTVNDSIFPMVMYMNMIEHFDTQVIPNQFSRRVIIQQ